MKASVVWIHAGQKTAIIAEKLVKKLELLQDTIIDGHKGRILERNIRVIRPPNETDPGLYELIMGLKMNQLWMLTLSINYIHNLDQQVKLINGNTLKLRTVLLNLKDKSDNFIFRHVDRIRRGRGINLTFYKKRTETAMETIRHLREILAKTISSDSLRTDV